MKIIGVTTGMLARDGRLIEVSTMKGVGVWLYVRQ